MNWTALRSKFGPMVQVAWQSPGFRLDLTVFLLNLGAMSLLARLFSDSAKRAATGSRPDEIVLVAITASLLFLAPIGATLKRWHAYQQPGMDKDPELGCLFTPPFYFSLIAVVFAVVNGFVMQTLFGKKEPPAEVFVGAVLGGFIFIVIHTILVFRYFTRPSKPPKSAFLQSRRSAVLGDWFLVANMIIFQLFWNLLAGMDLPRVSSVGDFAGRLFLLLFLALLIYFPPRMFFMIHDKGKRWAWVMMLVANLPLILRVLIGFAQDSGGFE